MNDLNDAKAFCTALRASDLFLESIAQLQFRLMALIIFEIEAVGGEIRNLRCPCDLNLEIIG